MNSGAEELSERCSRRKVVLAGGSRLVDTLRFSCCCFGKCLVPGERVKRLLCPNCRETAGTLRLDVSDTSVINGERSERGGELRGALVPGQIKAIEFIAAVTARGLFTAPLPTALVSSNLTIFVCLFPQHSCR